MAMLLRSLSRLQEDGQRSLVLKAMQTQAQKLCATCRDSGLPVLTAFTFELGKLFATIAHRPEKMTLSVLRSITHAVDFLSQAVEPEINPVAREKSEAQVSGG